MTLRTEPMPADRFDDWRSSTRERLIRLRHDSGLRPGAEGVQHADAFLEEFLPDGLESRTARLRMIVEGDAEIGTIWLAVNKTKAFIVDLAFTTEPTDEQLQELFACVSDTARAENAASLSIALFWQDTIGWRFVAGHDFAPSSIQMVLHPLPQRDVESAVQLTPMNEERFARFAKVSEADFAQELADSGRMTLAEATKESRRQMQLELPDGLETPGQKLYVATVVGIEVGILWIGIRNRDDREHAFILNVEVDAAQRRRGYGRAIMLAAEVEAQRLGIEAIGLHVFGVNQAAITLYEQLGYRRLEELLVLEL